MDSQRYWFEEVPEEQRYWFLVPWGSTPREEAEQEDDVFSPEEQNELGDIEAEVRSEQVFGTIDPDFREQRRRFRETLKRMEEVGYGANALSIPWWPEVVKYSHAEGIERVEAPKLFTTREAAEEELRGHEGTEPGAYLTLTEEYGEELADEAFNNTASLKAMWLDPHTLLDKLEDSGFLCVMVDQELKLREDFAEELKKQLEQREE